MRGPAGFAASRDKLEAVNRISALVRGGPEELGPGSKERKRVLEKVVDFLDLPVDKSRNKIELGRSVVEALGGTWTASCYSTGYTITLVGLDLVLLLAQAEVNRRGLGASDHQDLDLNAEAERILDACVPKLSAPLEMRSCVTEMHGRADPNWAQSEWPGFFFESTARAACMAIAGGGPGPRLGSVQFDYQLAHVWDFKAHSVHMGNRRVNKQMILNSARAVKACIEGFGGLGFVVAHGDATYDKSGVLHAWMAEQKTAAGIRSRRAASGLSRTLKASFTVHRLDAIFFESMDRLVVGMSDGWLRADFQAGFRQIEGTSRRRGKYLLDTARMPTDVVVARRDILPGGEAPSTAR